VLPTLAVLIPAAISRPAPASSVRVLPALRRRLKAATRKAAPKYARDKAGVLALVAAIVGALPTAAMTATTTTAQSGAVGGGGGGAVREGTLAYVLLEGLPGLLPQLSVAAASGDGGGRALAITAVRSVLAALGTSALGVYHKTCASAVAKCASDRYYRLAAEALRCSADALALCAATKNADGSYVLM
jgi:hypothetical protein